MIMRVKMGIFLGIRRWTPVALMAACFGVSISFAGSEALKEEVDQINAKLQGVNPGQGNAFPCQSPTVESPANSEGLCTDLYRLTSASGNYDDGTAIGNNTSTAESKIGTIKQQESDFFDKKFGAALQIKENSSFRTLGLSAFGLAHTPECEVGNQKAKCDASISKGLTEVAMRRIFPDPAAVSNDPTSFSDGATLRDLDLLLQNPAYLDLETTLASQAKSQIQDPEITHKIQNMIFPEVKRLIAKLLENSIADPKVRQNLMAKVNAIRFEELDCSSLSGKKNLSKTPSVASRLLPKSYYDSATNTFRYCNGYLIGNQSEIAITAAIAHELGHSIDPCNISNGPTEFNFKYSDPGNSVKSEAEYPLSGLISGLRSEKSVQAKKAFDGSGDFCHSDQITGSVSDWMTAEIMPDYIGQHFPNLSRNQTRIGYSNIFRGTGDSSNPTHADTEKRVNKILLVNPKVRQQMGCSGELDSHSTYCVVSGKSAK